LRAGATADSAVHAIDPAAVQAFDDGKSLMESDPPYLEGWMVGACQAGNQASNEMRLVYYRACAAVSWVASRPLPPCRTPTSRRWHWTI
jgi:hypothetical protein